MNRLTESRQRIWGRFLSLISVLYSMEDSSMTTSNLPSTFEELSAAAREFAMRQGISQCNSPKDLSTSIAVEAADLMRLFQRHSTEDSVAMTEDPVMRAKVVTELVDIFIYTLYLADQMNIDLCTAIQCRTEYDH